MSQRRWSIGPELTNAGVQFRVWAPSRTRVAVAIDGREHALAAEDDGYFAGVVRDAKAGTRYRFKLDDDRDTYPDPASRFQPDGPHGDSVVVDPAYEWTDAQWRGVALEDAVIAEVHIGTFTAEGTFAAAAERLSQLRDVGINVIELMPVNEFPGTFGWGYDGVDLYAPTRLYGTPADFRALVDAAHAQQIAVVLDVVYNHLGPDGCYLTKYSPDYFTDKYDNEWGAAVNFEVHGSRTFFAENAAYWIAEYHLDGLRIDATQSMFDESEPHILRAIADAVHEAAGERHVLLVAENEPQQTRIIDEYGLGAMWNDDFHHSARVAATGRSEAYYSDYRGRAQELVAMAQHGFLYQGQRYRWQNKRRGSPSFHLPPERLVCYLQNHDQIANSARGERLHALISPSRMRAMTALLLLQPQTPMLFQGQEFAASAPFLYFADHEPELAKKVREGRHEFVAQFPSVATMQELLAAPEDRATFEACKLDWSERERNAHVVALHRDLIALRRELPREIRAAVLTDDALVIRWTAAPHLLVLNLGRDLAFDPAPEPLLAPPAGCARWEIAWSSEWPQYGGSGTPELDTEDGWKVPGGCAVLLRPV
jgi:maltooligosyltrehalose trehalohydrolase